MQTGKRLAAAAAALAAAGCTTILDAAMGRAGTVIGERIGERVGDTVGTAAAGAVHGSLVGLSPAMMQLYVQGLFTVAFWHGGYAWEQVPYAPGQWTRWKAEEPHEADEFTKAFLARRADGAEWWQIVARNDHEGTIEEVVIEALFGPPDASGMRNLLRLRRLFPGDGEPVEVPVTEENRAHWYRNPTRLTEESLAGATQEMETVTTPAGTFRARRVRYADVQGTISWWLVDKVPGGLVKAQHQSRVQEEGEERVQTATTTLVAYGGDARTRLGSF